MLYSLYEVLTDTFTLQYESDNMGGTRTVMEVGVVLVTGILEVEEHTSQADTEFMLLGNPLPGTLNYVPYTDPLSMEALKNYSGVVDRN